MRVLHIYKGDLYGGIEAMLSTLARTRNLCREMEPHFALCSPGRLSSQLAAESVPLYDLGQVRGRNPISVWRARQQLADILRRHSIEVAICHGTWAQALFGSTVQRAGITQIFWQHDLITGKGWIESLAARTQPNLVISNSSYSQSTLAGLYPEVASRLLYCPVELFDQRAFRAEREKVRQQFNTPSDRCVIIQVSRLHPGKGHAPHLSALGRLRELPNWECWMVGGPQHPDEVRYFNSLQERCRELGVQDRVRFLGERNDVPELLAASEIYCQPNTEPEAFGLTFIEALVMGLPLVTSRIGAACEIVDDSCGVLLEPGDPVRLAATQADLAQSGETRARLGKAGPARAARLCAPESQLRLLADTLAKLCCEAVPV
jgi:glycosyltransferase involved in cell wall biosynthesis